MTAALVSPIQLSLLVPLAPADAFELFTARIAEWWPLSRHSIAQDRAVGCFIEPSVGGRVYEQSADGDEHEWGRVVVWDPPRRMAMRWYPGAGPATEVEVTFTPADDGTFVELEHRGWDALGEQAEAKRSNYANGWQTVFTERFGTAAGV